MDYGPELIEEIRKNELKVEEEKILLAYEFANESHFDDNIKNPYCPIYTTSIKYSSVSFASISSKLSRNALGSFQNSSLDSPYSSSTELIPSIQCSAVIIFVHLVFSIINISSPFSSYSTQQLVSPSMI